MIKQPAEQRYEIGMIGLGVMGRNLVLNMAEHGFSVVVYDKETSEVEAMRQEAGDLDIRTTINIREMTALLHKPRTVMIIVPAGAPVDSVIGDLLPYLDKGDLIVDAGNSHFEDTDVRTRHLATRGIQFLGVGLSGGEDGARHGPCIMPGGLEESYARVSPVFEAVAARVHGDLCVTWLGHGSAGHFVNMVHNGIEYAAMQLIAGTYDLMKCGMGLNDDELHEVYSAWNKGELNSYLLEITSDIFGQVDEKTGKRLIGEILGVASQKGTGMWTSQCALALEVPIPSIDAAVAMRYLSVFEEERGQASVLYLGFQKHFAGDRDAFLAQMGRALFAGMIICYAQGLALLAVASEKYGYGLDLEAVARIWRGGCILRTAFLEDICVAFRARPNLANVLLDPNLSQKVMTHREDLCHVVCQAAQLGVPAPGLMACLGYLDAFCNIWMPTNLIQAQRDYFGAHTYERSDAKGAFHTAWDKVEKLEST